MSELASHLFKDDFTKNNFLEVRVLWQSRSYCWRNGNGFGEVKWGTIILWARKVFDNTFILCIFYNIHFVLRRENNRNLNFYENDFRLFS